ncbi:MAG: hypothetical protein DRP01_11050, partial [Archaeoglobales archaeon]
ESRIPPCDYTDPESVGGVCVLCDIFGAPGLASRVEFGTFTLMGDSRNFLEVLELDHGESVKAVKPGAVFEGSLSFRLHSFELGLLFVGMGFRDGKWNPMLLGKSKYRVRSSQHNRCRFGRVVFELEAIAFSKHVLSQSRLPPHLRMSLINQPEALSRFVGWAVEEAKSHYGDAVSWDYDELRELEQLTASHGG